MSTTEPAVHPYRVMGELILRELDHFDGLPERRKAFANPEDYKVDVALALTKLQREVQKNNLATRAEPFVACLRIQKNGADEYLLISRSYAPDHAPVSARCDFASYLSPMGSIASRALGQPFEVKVPRGTFEVVLLERNEFRSVKKNSWDAVANEYAAGSRIRLSIPSARAALAQPATEADPEATAATGPDAAVTEHEAELKVVWESMDEPESGAAPQLEAAAGRRVVVPSVAAKVELRDRPILDDLQDPIFRLPIASRLVLTGAAGTGKSTVLIKRLSQKTKGAFLQPEEIVGFSGEQLDQLLDPERSWVLFTPNDLLRNYLKEALAREQLPATETTVRTWSDARTRLARDVLGILKVGDKKGVFTRTDAPVFQLTDARRKKFLEKFRSYCDDRYRRLLKSAARALESTQSACQTAERGSWRDEQGGAVSSLPAEVLEFNREFVEFCDRALDRIGVPTADPYETMIDFQVIRPDYTATRQRATALGDKVARVLLARVEGLRAHLVDVPVAEAPARLRALIAMNDAERRRDGKVGTRARQALKALETSPYAALVALVGAWERGLSVVPGLLKGLDVLLRRLPHVYQDFRTEFRNGGPAAARWLTADGGRSILDRKISDEEVDLLVYAMLSVANDLFARRPQLLWNASDSNLLEAVKRQLRTVVGVDEAPDFSWVQLGCMYQLAHPAFRSFCLSGDLMQRVTETGLRHWDEVQAFAPDTSVHTLERVYRQSRSLLHVAGILYEIAMKEAPPFASPFLAEDEPQPLRFQSASRPKAVEWIAARIVEIYEAVGYLPTIAVFVADEADVLGTAEMLAGTLAQHAIEVEACEKGKVLGVGDHVRVFAVEHIKGLEFHAVFLMDFERLNRRDGDLALRYLYLGLTRSVMFLGVTMTGRFPTRLAPLADVLAEGDWKRFAEPGPDRSMPAE